MRIRPIKSFNSFYSSLYYIESFKHSLSKWTLANRKDSRLFLERPFCPLNSRFFLAFDSRFEAIFRQSQLTRDRIWPPQGPKFVSPSQQHRDEAVLTSKRPFSTSDDVLSELRLILSTYRGRNVFGNAQGAARGCRGHAIRRNQYLNRSSSTYVDSLIKNSFLSAILKS